jgi:hypothetical protein
METTFSNKVKILSVIYFQHKYTPVFEEFVRFNDLGLPLARLVDVGLCSLEGEGELYINDTFNNLIEDIGVKDTGFATLEEIFASKNKV